jgi:hypothetical protein
VRVVAKFGAVLSVIFLPLNFFGANNFWALSPKRIDYRSMLSATTRRYKWSDVREIETGCYTGKSTTYNFVLTMTDGTHIDLMEESPYDFSVAYPQVQSALRGQSYLLSTPGLVGSCVARASRRWLAILAKRPTE